MKLKFVLAAVLFAMPMLAQTPATTDPVLPKQVFGALVFYNQGAPGAKINGSFFAAIPFPNAPAGTYVYNAVDVLSVGRGQIMTVPTTGLAQHIVWFTPKVELFGLLGAGISMSPVSTGTGTNVTPAFGGGAGVNIGIGKGFYIPLVAKVVNAQGGNTLVGGIGISWGR
ncbi:MAG: hypothetical protein KGL39_22175 [Patescibacteria group bacterium]|nr:hypothetical protein [Patescibacteria group bacterium]